MSVRLAPNLLRSWKPKVFLLVFFLHSWRSPTLFLIEWMALLQSLHFGFSVFDMAADSWKRCQNQFGLGHEQRTTDFLKRQKQTRQQGLVPNWGSYASNQKNRMLRSKKLYHNCYPICHEREISREASTDYGSILTLSVITSKRTKFSDMIGLWFLFFQALVLTIVLQENNSNKINNLISASCKPFFYFSRNGNLFEKINVV